MVRFFRILLEGIWEIMNMPIPIDEGVSITPISIMVFTAIIGLLVKYVKVKGEKSE